ncbi:hypothetical protein Tco_0154896 [Tanacetum coccineum]
MNTEESLLLCQVVNTSYPMNMDTPYGPLELDTLYWLESWVCRIQCSEYAVSVIRPEHTAGEKNTTADYNCLKTFYCQEDKDGLKR